MGPLRRVNPSKIGIRKFSQMLYFYLVMIEKDKYIYTHTHTFRSVIMFVLQRLRSKQMLNFFFTKNFF